MQPLDNLSRGYNRTPAADRDRLREQQRAAQAKKQREQRKS